MKTVLAVAFGGAIGALGRYYAVGWAERLLNHWLGPGFPYGTLAVNIIGSFALGVLVESLALAFSIAPELRLLLVVGMLGGFTTFSAFSLDVVLLIERGDSLRAAFYVLGSVGLSVGGLFAGLRVMRWVLA
ncbi:MAG: fluoride efflux transporter CrcB [Alphaproteobacteria bacterium]|nr:fluoride efflux transporter CrcB [Pseudomonadota bacterium]